MANNYGLTPLYGASANRDLDMIQLLIDKRASVATADNDGSTPLLTASFNGHLDVVSL
jgi:ankyrin repeat protein